LGEKDLEVLYQIYKEATKHHFYFKYDAGKFETAIEFISDGRFFHPPIAHNWEESKDKGTEIKCPDLLEWNNKLVIEYEEETGNKRLGAKFARKGHGHEGDLDKERDDNRNKLYKEFIRVVKGIKPKYFIMENVKGILPFKDEIVKDFEKVGYNVEVKIIKGEEIGMQQKRNRVFFIGKCL